MILRLDPGSALWLCARGPCGVFSAAGGSFLHPNKCPSGTWRGQGTVMAVDSPRNSQALRDPHQPPSLLCEVGGGNKEWGSVSDSELFQSAPCLVYLFLCSDWALTCGGVPSLVEETQPLTQEILQAGGGLGSAPPVLGNSL